MEGEDASHMEDPGAEVLDWIKRRKRAEDSLTSFCFPTVATIQPASVSRTDSDLKL